ncbi:uncharacterized protein L201_000412 [Kwoniella dendrophila CBS 6074]|uniref:Protein MAK11 n=1 Tax=Kwoniella dendrophila CBS 6074 TaxID=1295534 RepID=A0AAX4JKW0_9TREE
MGKQGKSKSNKGGPVTARPAPYGKKPKVEVKFEGGPSTAGHAPQTSTNKSNQAKKQATKTETKPKASAAKTTEAKAVQEVSSKDKGKSKATNDVDVELSGPSGSPGTFIIIAGSYEKLLYGLEGSYDGTSDKPTLEPIFIFPAHLACVKAVAASKGGKWLATGSEDEFVKVWDLRRRKEVGSLSQHTGSITSLHFPTSSHLITTSADSTLSLFRTSDWALLKSLKGHSGRVNHVDVHPTGRVALSVGKDNTLKMWDLMRGRGAASLPLGSEAEMVKFSQSGTHFAVLFPRKIQIYSLTLKLLHTLETKSRFNTLLFATLPAINEDEEEQELLCVGTEKGVVEVYTIEVGLNEPSDDSDEEDEEEGEDPGSESKGKGAEVIKIGTLIGHTNRIKSISALPFAVPTSAGQIKPTILLTTASSDGFINLYDLSLVTQPNSTAGIKKTVEAVASYNTKGSRLTCVYLADGQVVGKKQSIQKKDATPASNDAEDIDDDEEDNEDDDEEGMYESGEDDGEEDEEMAVEFEDEEEEEDEEEGEYED